PVIKTPFDLLKHLAVWQLQKFNKKSKGVLITGLKLKAFRNPQLGWGFRKAFSFKPVIKTPFDLLKHLAVWQLQKFNKKSKGVLITGLKLKAFRNPQ
ncbi:hypothetical protein, partial [Salmonella enterica]|uniref:hypothetical protein n=1 Tax=Salmonella enterica TaxID=28901 RepID=UPI002B002BEB